MGATVNKSDLVLMTSPCTSTAIIGTYYNTWTLIYPLAYIVAFIHVQVGKVNQCFEQPCLSLTGSLKSKSMTCD